MKPVVSLNREVGRSFILLRKSIHSFREFFKKKDFWGKQRLYYLARGTYKRGQKCYQNVLKRARRLAGPVEGYVIFSERVAKWRKDLLEREGVLAKDSVFEELLSEFVKDKVLTRWMGKEEIESFLRELYEKQTKGKRELPNIKLRMMIEKIENLLLEAEELGKRAQNQVKKDYAEFNSTRK